MKLSDKQEITFRIGSGIEVMEVHFKLTINN